MAFLFNFDIVTYLAYVGQDTLDIIFNLNESFPG